MTNITQQVRDFLNKHPFIVRSLADGIINARQLAFYILKKTEMSASIHAVLSAVRRYEQEITSPKKK